MVENIHCHIVVMTIFSSYGAQLHIFVWRNEDKNERIFFNIITVWSHLITAYTDAGLAKDVSFESLWLRARAKVNSC